MKTIISLSFIHDVVEVRLHKQHKNRQLAVAVSSGTILLLQYSNPIHRQKNTQYVQPCCVVFICVANKALLIFMRDKIHFL